MKRLLLLSSKSFCNLKGKKIFSICNKLRKYWKSLRILSDFVAEQMHRVLLDTLYVFNTNIYKLKFGYHVRSKAAFCNLRTQFISSATAYLNYNPRTVDEF